MIDFIRKMLGRGEQRTAEDPPAKPKSRPAPANPSADAAPRGRVGLNVTLEGEVDERGPGKNVRIRKKYVREDTGTHETLRILDDSALDTGEETGIDPYNTGNFDRSRNWDKRFRN